MGNEIKELIDGLRNFREEYVLALIKEARLKDRHGNIWDIKKIEFDEQWTVLRLGLDGTNNYKSVIISWTANWNELEDYELIKKDSED